MKDVYAVLLLHSAGQKVTEDSLSKVLTAAGVSEEQTKIKALVANLEGVNIDDAIKQAAFAPAAAATAGVPSAAGEVKKAEPQEATQEEKEAEASAGLAALFG